MKTALSIPLLSNPFVDRFNEGGSFFMSLILICLLVSISCLIIGFLQLHKNLEKSKKMTVLASEISVLGLVIGFLASIIGMITAFDSIEVINTNTSTMAAGLKVSFLAILLGCVTFILPRIGIIFLKVKQK